MPASSGLWNPKTYGAKYDGRTDDHNAVQKAIDLCSAAGGGTVTVLGNVFNTTPLILKRGVTLDLAHWNLTGPASPHIALPAEPGHDRMGLRGGFITSSTGDGVQLIGAGGAGNYQLGWPRITVENVTIVECAARGLVTGRAAIELRLINVVALRSGYWGFQIESTDSVLLGCTAAAGKSAGIVVQGGNNKLVGCKGYGNALHGIWIGGAGRHTLSACESQDNARDGYNIGSDWNTLAACLADSDADASFNVYGHNNTLAGVAAMHGGGGSRQIPKAGFRLSGQRNIVTGNSNCPVTVESDSGQNRRTIMSQGAGGHVID